MSYPPPPGLKTSQPSSSSSTPQPHPSLPARPPPPVSGSSSFKPAFTGAPSSANGAPGTNSYSSDGGQGAGHSGYGGVTGFKPRSVVGGTADWRNNEPNYLGGPTAPSHYPSQQSTYSSSNFQQGTYSYSQQAQPQQHIQGSYGHGSPPQIQNPFPVPSQGQSASGHGGRDRTGNGSFDPELEAQIAQWQSAYMSKDDTSGSRGPGGAGPSSAGGANAVPLGNRPNASTLTNQEMASAAKPDSGVASVVSGADGKQKTVIRSGGGQTWQDASLLEWDPAHFRLFVGNLAGEVTDESLLKAFSKYASVQKARVIRDKRTTKSRGYGFVSFSDGDEYFQAAKDMQGKYIGSHPVQLRRSTTEIRPVNPSDKKKGGKGGGGGPGGHANTGAGVHKKQNKTKGGLKIIG